VLSLAMTFPDLKENLEVVIKGKNETDFDHPDGA
jgi:hypothetical protein